jgi:cytochrome c553
MSEDAYMKIMIPVDSQAEIDTALKKYAGVDQLDCEKEGYCILQGPQEALEGVLESLGYEDSIQEFVCPDCGAEVADGQCDKCAENDECSESDENDEEDESDEDESDENDESDEDDENDENDESDEDESDENDEEDESDEDESDEDDEEDEEDECNESYATTEAIRAVVANHAQLRMEAVKETLDHQFMETTLFESMEEDQAKSMKAIVTEAVDQILEKACVAVVSDTTKLFESYVNKEIIPAIDSYIKEEVVPSIVAKLDENVDGYLRFVGEELSEEMLKEGMIVQSPKSEILEGFTGELLALIESKLQIVPEREDALLKAKESITELTEEIQELKIEQMKTKKALIEAKRESYVMKHMPENLSEAQKETLSNYAAEELKECATMTEFRKAFNKACKDIREYYEEPEIRSVSKPDPAPRKTGESIADVLFRMG